MASHVPSNSVTMDRPEEPSNQSATGDTIPPASGAASTAAETTPTLGTQAAPQTRETPQMIATWPGWLQQQWYDAQARQRVEPNRQPWLKRATSRAGLLITTIVLIVAIAGFGVGIGLNRGGTSTPTTSGSSSSSTDMSGMDMTSTSSSSSSSTTDVPNATVKYGGQTAKYVLDEDGAKHFTFTAEQVMWDVEGGHRVLAWTLDGMVPGPTIHVTAGDHVRITIVNKFPEPTSIHWHGLEVPMAADGVPPLGMDAIKPGASYTYDFTIQDADAGTHWYHSHYDDMNQVGNGLYGAFIIDPRPGSPEEKTAIHADVTYPVFLAHMGGYYLISGKAYPDTQPLDIKHGQTVHIEVFGADSTLMHPLHLHGHTFSIVAEDGHMLADPIEKDTVQVGPGETYDLVFYAWGQKGDIYPLHCHILSHVMNPGQTGSEMGGMIVAVRYVG